MLKQPNLFAAFKTLGEVDLGALRRQAESPFHIAVIGASEVGRSSLIAQLMAGPGARVAFAAPAITEHQLNEEIYFQPYSLVILILEAGLAANVVEYSLLEKLRSLNVPFIICDNKLDLAPRWPGTPAGVVSSTVRQSSVDRLVPELLQAYRGREVLLARHLPALREPVSRKLIEDTSRLNATYSLTTGLAEMNLFLDLPLNLADMAVLTKNQAVMAYKIALACGLPSDWRETIPKIATVVGSGFLWRLLARQLVGLVPAIGLAPKVAVAYAGTYAIGRAVYLWCANDEKITPALLKTSFARALEQGREVARRLTAKSSGSQSQL